MTEWIALILAVGTALTGLAVSHGYNRRRFEEMEHRISQNGEHHADHYKSTRGLESAAAVLSQRVMDHTQRDEETFARIEKLFESIQEDIKELLRRNGGR